MRQLGSGAIGLTTVIPKSARISFMYGLLGKWSSASSKAWKEDRNDYLFCKLMERSAHSKSRGLTLNAGKLSQWVSRDSGFNARPSVYHGNSERDGRVEAAVTRCCIDIQYGVKQVNFFLKKSTYQRLHRTKDDAAQTLLTSESS